MKSLHLPDGQESPDEICLRVASSQEGLITRQQALEAGLTSDGIYYRHSKREWIRLFPSVYRMGGAPESGAQTLRGAALWLCSRAVVSNETAAGHWGFDGFAEDLPLHFASSKHIRVTDPRLIVHKVVSFNPGDRCWKGGIEITTPWRTLIDLSGSVAEQRLEISLDSALRQGLVSLPRLRRAVIQSGGRGRRGIGVLRDLIDMRDDSLAPPDSALESPLLRLIRDSDLPEPVPQYTIRHLGKFIARPDFAYPDHKVAIEAQSYRHHFGHKKFNEDIERLDLLSSLGWRVHFFTWWHIKNRPQWVIARIRRTLAEKP